MVELSDEATGLPPLEEVEEEDAILVLAWATTEGVVASPTAVEPAAVRYLSVRGLIVGEKGLPQWAQVHLAVPIEIAVDVAAALAMGGALGG